MSKQDPDKYAVTPILTPTDSGVIRYEDREPPKPRERQPSNELPFGELIAANQLTYRRNNVRDAIDYFMKHHPESIPYFEAALADASELKNGTA